MSLSQTNRRVHERLGRLYAEFVEALLRNRGDVAEARWGDFRSALNEHAGLEESNILPLAEKLEVTGKGDPRVIRHDHRLLDEALDQVHALLGDLRSRGQGDWTKVIARNLQTLARFEQVFEHHTVRECDFLYAAFDERADEETRGKVAAVLARSLG